MAESVWAVYTHRLLCGGVHQRGGVVVGAGAGFYVNATQPLWSKHYNMYDYVTKEVSALPPKETLLSGGCCCPGCV